MNHSSVILTRCCGCNKQLWYKIRFYEARIDTDLSFDKLPEYIGVADLIVKDAEAHITAFVMIGNNRFRRIHDNDLETQIRYLFPCVRIVYWERHKGGETIKLMREL